MPPRPSGLPSWAELAEDWLLVKRVGRRNDDPGNSDRSRRADLRRWADAINTVEGRDSSTDSASLEAWDLIGAELGSSEVLLRALDYLGTQSLSAATRRRMLSTLRGFCRYLVRRGAMSSDPTAAEELVVRIQADDAVRAFTGIEIERLLATAELPAPSRRSAWPARDVAIISMLSQCGLRVGELCELRFADIDTSDEPLLRLRHGTKGGRQRVVPLPSSTLGLVRGYIAERSARSHHGRADDVVFVRHNGAELNQQFVDAMLRCSVRDAGVTAPGGALAHALRHSYGQNLAARGVPLTIIQQLMGHVDPRTTSIYTRAHAGDLTHALHEAGVL